MPDPKPCPSPAIQSLWGPASRRLLGPPGRWPGKPGRRRCGFCRTSVINKVIKLNMVRYTTEQSVAIQIGRICAGLRSCLTCKDSLKVRE